jgi:inner membrane protein
MSSIIGHVSIGVALFLGNAAAPSQQSRLALPVLVLLAILPDFDYFALWLFGIDSEPRFTHSLAFALCAAGIAWACLRRLGEPASRLPFRVLVLASGSHVLLDLLVGVHPVCVFWPLALPELQSPIGVLPSAGALRLSNFYFWRNLLIECGVLFPVLFLYLALKRKVRGRTLAAAGLVLLPVWLAALAWSLKVHA